MHYLFKLDYKNHQFPSSIYTITMSIYSSFYTSFRRQPRHTSSSQSSHFHYHSSHFRYITGVLLLLFCQLGQLCGRVDATPEDWASGTSQFHITNDDRVDSYTSAYINVSKRTHSGEWKNETSKVSTGRYGGGYIGPASGIVIHVTNDNDREDHSGCQLPLRSTRPNRQLPEPGTPWIALIKRGKCNFEVKVDNAFKSNAAGVLVYNDRDSSNLDKMKLSSENSRNISAVFTYKWKGEALASAVDDRENDKVFVYITIAEHTNTRSASINRTSVLFVSITFIVLMIISLAWLVFYYVQRFRYIHAKDRLSRRLCNAAKKALSKIPTKTIKSDDKEIGDSECCAICIEPYKTSDILRILPCTHEFHKSCIDPWLLEHRTCPMCKMDILKHYGFAFTGSQESILHMDIEEVAGLESVDIGPRRSGGISPLPQIRAVIVADHQRSYSSSLDGDDGSRSSSPNELTPSLSSSHHHTHHHPSRQRSQQTTSVDSAATTASMSTTTPIQVTPSITTAAVNTTTIILPVRQDLCVSCIAAKQAQAQMLTTQTQVHQPPSSPTSSATAHAQQQNAQASVSVTSTAATLNVDDIDIECSVASDLNCDVEVVVKRQHSNGDVIDSDVDVDSDSENTNSEASSQRVETSKLVQ